MKTNGRLARRLSILTALLLSLSCLGCLGLGGYKIGAQTLFAPDIKTVYVPVFKSDLIRPDVAERLTEAVCKRIEARSPYKVVGRPTADSVLVGRITRKSQSVSLYNSYSDPRQKTMTLAVEITWKDRRDRDLRQFDAIPWKDGSGTAMATTRMVAEFGHSELTAEQQLIENIADQIVGMMETPW